MSEVILPANVPMRSPRIVLLSPSKRFLRKNIPRSIGVFSREKIFAFATTIGIMFAIKAGSAKYNIEKKS